MKRLFQRWVEWTLPLMLLVLLAACSGKTPASTPTAQPVDTIPPARTGMSVMAEGKVVPAKQAALSFSTNGVVAEVLVKEGDLVKNGQVLIRLQGNEQIESAISAAELELLNAKQSLDDLKEKVDVERSKVQLEVANANKELDKAQRRVYSREYRRGNQDQIDIARANYVVSEDGVEEAEKNFDRVSDRGDDDPVRAEYLSQMAAARQRRDSALANLNYLLDKPNALDVAQIDAQLAVAQSNLADAVRRLTRLKDGPDAKQLALAEARVENAQVSLDAARARLTDLELKAPFDGTVSALNTTEGEFAAPGSSAVTLADFSSVLVETTDLTELNIARVKLGQPAMIHFDALPEIGLIGRVTTIKTMGENHQGDIVYTVVLKLENPDERLRWNMTASVNFLEKEQEQ